MIDVVSTADLALVHLVTCWPEARLSVIVKGVFELVAGGPMRRAEGPIHFLADEPLEGSPGRLRYASDLPPFKPAADVLLVGAAKGAGDEPMLRIGPHAFEAEGGSPVAFAPVAPTAPERQTRLGTYDARWVKERWPWPPEDFDPRYFCAAPRAMQIDGYLRGDERLVLDGVCADAARFATQLPGLRVRCFMLDRADAMVELALRLDTLWVDAEARRAALVWRGITDVSSEDAPEVKGIYLASEPLSEPPKSEQHHQEQRALAVLRRAKTKAPPPSVLPSGRPANRNVPPPPDDTAFLAELKKALEQAQAPKEVLAAVQGAKGAQAVFDKLLSMVDTDPKKAEALLAQAKEQTRRAFVDQGIDPSIFDEPPEPKKAKPAAPAWTRERVQAAAAAGESMEGADLRRRDLSDLDLSGAKLKGALLSETVLKGTKLYDADLRGALLVKADLSGASLGIAKLGEADLTGVTAPGLDLWRAEMPGAIFDQAMLAGARLDEAQAEAASFREADLTGAKLGRANFTRALLTGAVLEKVDARGAVLAEATLERARAANACFAEADLRKLRAGHEASFAGADLRSAQADGGVFMGADLTGADLSKGRFVRADLSRSKMDGAKVRGATCEGADFTRTSLRGAELFGANLAGACLDGADLSQADARKANLYEAELWRAKTDGLQLDGAHVAMTKLVMR